MDETVTQLYVHCHGLTSENRERIADLMTEVELPVSSTESMGGKKYVQMTNGFVNTDQNEEQVDKLFEKLESEFEEAEVSRSIGEGSGYKQLPFDWIYEVIVRDEESVPSSTDGDWERWMPNYE